MSIQRILDAHREGRITTEQAMWLFDLRREVIRRRRRRAFWRGVIDGVSLGPVRRWIARWWRKWSNRSTR